LSLKMQIFHSRIGERNTNCTPQNFPYSVMIKLLALVEHLTNKGKMLINGILQLQI